VEGAHPAPDVVENLTQNRLLFSVNALIDLALPTWGTPPASPAVRQGRVQCRAAAP
jgi:hypothetical protein